MAVKKPKGNPALGQIQLTRNFYLNEFVETEWGSRNGVANFPNAPGVMPNLYKLAELLEEVRKVCGNKGVFITSGYRCPEVNTGIGGSKTSDHLTGSAADIRVPGYGSPIHVAEAIIKSGIKFGQLIYEGSWVHISLPEGINDGQVLTAVFTRGKPTTYRAGIEQIPPAAH